MESFGTRRRSTAASGLTGSIVRNLIHDERLAVQPGPHLLEQHWSPELHRDYAGYGGLNREGKDQGGDGNDEINEALGAGRNT